MPIPMGMKAMPITKKVGRTVPAVRMGCHAGNLCCLKAESEMNQLTAAIPQMTTRGKNSLPVGFLLLAAESEESILSLDVMMSLVNWLNL